MPLIRLLLLAAVMLTGTAVADEQATRVRKLNLPDPPFRYSEMKLPKHFQQVALRYDNSPPDNLVTDHGATLGRVLFYDRTLSANDSISCASCHQQRLAFTDGAPFSTGFDGQKVTRNSMSLVNARYHLRGRFFWDERADTLEHQVLMPIENPIEMGHSMPAVVNQLKSDPLYPDLFSAAFGDAAVTQTRIARALAQFIRSIVSYRSKYDMGRRQVTSVYDRFPNFTDEENYGKQQFLERAGCAICHLEDEHLPGEQIPERRDHRQSAFFFALKPVVNGIDGETEGTDPGVGQYSPNPSDVGAFKIPSLRNVAVTGPYMHDGRFTTIDSVIEHYNWSVRPHPNLDVRLAEIAAGGLAIPERKKVALAKFLHTLTDHELLNDPKYSDPFIR